MSLQDWSKLVISVGACQLAGILGALVTMQSVRTWYSTVAKPSFTPPSWIFGPVWTVLYLMMGVAAFLVWRRGLQEGPVRVAMLLFVVQLVLNALWSPVFFGMHSIGGGLVVIVLLWLAIVATMVAFFPLNKLAGGLLIPYLAWVSFATVLNGAIWHLNRG